MKTENNLSRLIIFALIVLDLLIWQGIIFVKSAESPELYFLDVGQGDSELLVLPGGVKILTDAGPNQKVLESLEKVLGPSDRYIDLAIISHPQLDHFNGFNDILSRYQIGAFIFNGRTDATAFGEWETLMAKIKEKKIPLIALASGDKIHFRENQIEIISPGPDFLQSAELNDTGLVELVKTPAFRALLTADIDMNVEKYLLRKFSLNNLQASILKVGHHGSKFSSSQEFLETVQPKVSVIEVGARNRYGHPTKEAMDRLQSSTNLIFRTDKNGTIKVIAEQGKLRVFKVY
ncbi:MAG: hypothetical protein HYT13_03070 [Candidatus Liptonbacteria bacterium]|nr:hypothetical protein [Candidatus Liptonbacteria bacterium]